MTRNLGFAAVALVACGGSQPPAPAPVAEKKPAPPVESAPSPRAEPVAPPAAEPAVQPTPEVAPRCPAAAPPPELAPPHARTAQPGDGAWTRLGDPSSGDRAAQGEALLYRTVLHPHPASRFVTVTLAAVDLCRVEIGFMPGSQDVPKVTVPVERGLVPESARASLIAVFNGGWKPEHGRWGMFKSGVSMVPPRETGCTVLVDAQGRADIVSGPPPATDGLDAYRQTPPCLFDESTLHPRLAAGDEAPWGGKVKDVVTRRRSAIGIGAERRWLFYAAGEEAGAGLLAKALMHAGARTGAELDINWYWTRFLLFGEKDSKLAVTATLISGMEYQSTSYVERRSDRDFFYLLRRSAPP